MVLGMCGGCWVCNVVAIMFFFFFFKQKTAYEIHR